MNDLRYGVACFGAFLFPLVSLTASVTIDAAIARNDIASVKQLLAEDPGLASQGENPRLPPLHQAILRQRVDIAQSLIEAGADVGAVDSSQRTPAHLAVERNLPEVIPVLAKAAAPLSELDKVGWTPLHWATAKDQLEVAKVLVAGGADVHKLTARGGTILHEAASSGGEAVVQFCLELGVDTSIVASDGRTALDVAREFENEAAIAWLSPLEWKPAFQDTPVPEELSTAIGQALPKASIAPVSAKRRILIVSATSGFRHQSIPTGIEALVRMGESSDAYDAVVSDDPAHFEAAALARFDAVVLLNTTQDFFMPNARQRNQFTETEWVRLQMRHDRLMDNLVDYVRGGGGLVGIHSATDSCYNHADYGEMIGGYFDGHPWNARSRVMIVVEDPGHALIQPVFGATTEFELVEEIYQFKSEPYSRERLRILLQLDPGRSDAPKQAPKREDNDYPVAWVQSFGNGRVFYTSLGHNHAIYTDPRILKHYLAGIQFACGDLEADTTPSALSSEVGVRSGLVSCCGAGSSDTLD